MIIMGSDRSVLFTIFVLTCFCFTHGLYEDQIGKFDWKRNFIGKVKLGHYDSVKRVVVATEENVLASLHLKTGQIAWRQFLENSPHHHIELLHVNHYDIISVSGDGNSYYVRAWDSNSGVLLSEWTLLTESEVKYWTITDDTLFHLVPVSNSYLEVTQYDVRTGQMRGKSSKRLSAAWIKDFGLCAAVTHYWACVSDDMTSTLQLHYINLLNNEVSTPTVIGQFKEGSGTIKISPQQGEPAALLVTKNGVNKMVHFKADGAHVLSYDLTAHAIIAPNGTDEILLQMEIDDGSGRVRMRKINLADHAESTIITECESSIGLPRIISGICRGAVCRLLLVNRDDAVVLLNLPAGKILWSREEALSKIQAAEFVELPVSDLDASIEHEFDPANDMFSVLYNRLLTQFNYICVLLHGQTEATANNLIQDNFGLHKLILVYTNVGKLFAIDTLNGNVIWTKFLLTDNIASETTHLRPALFMQRSARYSPWTAQCSIILRDSQTGKSFLLTFDPITGHSENGIQHLSYNIKQAMLLPYEDDTHLKALLVLSTDNKVYLYPAAVEPLLLQHKNAIYLYTISKETGTMQGFSVVHSVAGNLKATPMWQLSFGKAQIIATSTRPSSETVHSQGRVLADRSVLYKYINPNLVAIATLSDDAAHKHVLSVYLVDGVTGLIVYSTVHRKASQPIHLIHSENWIVYSYMNERFRRVELVAAELYEGAVQSNSTVFSSHAVSQIPHVETQAYIFPFNPVAMRATLTERGITSKHILMATSSGAVVEVPWIFLEPRGSSASTSPEEGYIPYMPELPIPAEANINYNISLARIHDVQVAPARLESTCLVFVYGLDIFYTRVTPSKTFDLLKEDFDHWLIGIVLVGLILASYITKRLASRKALKQAWK